MSTKHPSYNGRMMKALRLEPVDQTPIWLMRQAGRYMAEYRAVRSATNFLDLCRNPDLCAEVMLTAVERLGVDAAIIFSDLLPILQAMGMDLEFAAGEGPVIHNAIQDTSQVDILQELEDAQALDFVYQTVQKTRAGLNENIPVIGFSGAPFTLASYAVEGGASRDYARTKYIMYTDAGAWSALMSRLSRAITLYLTEQIKAGAQIVQLFDSWVGCLGVSDYENFVLSYVQQIIHNLKTSFPETPVIYFATGNPMLLPSISRCGGDCIGVDWRIEINTAWDIIGHHLSIQGNMDPLVLLTKPEIIRHHVSRILHQTAGRPGHIFNLGHGINKNTPVENVIALVKMVHEMTECPLSKNNL
ncbi:MAG: uroporphyrinogen decarboxylase [Planctomycetia bacterium]|nr:uroporphyrinogen decarboxylase [Planctomycetia bacterium]